MQIPLPLRLRLSETFTFKNFYEGPNQAILYALRSMVHGIGVGDSFSAVYLWGEYGVGRTHLLQACCHAVSHKHPSLSSSAIYLPLSSSDLLPSALQDLEVVSLVCLDDIDAVLGNIQWEEALLHFYNRVLERKGCLLMAGNHLSTQLPCLLPDLQSRLSWGLVFRVLSLSDEEKLNVLHKQAKQHGFELSKDVALFLLTHYRRDMGALLQLLKQLDYASLVHHRKITIPFVKQVVEETRQFN